MNVLITGANGQLGNCIRKSVINSRDHYLFTDISELDITDSCAVTEIVKRNDIKVIINCAAYTDVEKAESEVVLAERINAIAVDNLARAIKKNDGTLIHLSTDYVFGSLHKNIPFTENEEVKPLGVYGLTKLHGEQAIESSGCKALIIRTAWLYSEYGKNFVKTMLSLTSQKPELKVVFDQCGSPTYAQDLSDGIIKIVEERLYPGNEGIYHFSNEGVCSWYDFAKAIGEIAGHDNCEIKPCHSDEFPSKVVRPSYSVLDKSKIKKTFRLVVPYWRDSLKKCINNMKL